MTKRILEEGENYRVEVDAGVALCKVWSRPDLDSERGARLAAQKVHICSALAAGAEARGMLFDLREAPKVTGPKTQESLEKLIHAWESAGRPIAVIASPAAPLQKLQLTRIARGAAPRHAEVFVDFDEATHWLERRMPARRASGGPAALKPSPSQQPSPAQQLITGRRLITGAQVLEATTARDAVGASSALGGAGLGGTAPAGATPSLPANGLPASRGASLPAGKRRP